MEIITGNKYDFRQLIEGAYQRLERYNNPIDRYAVIDYLTQLHQVESVMTGQSSELNDERCFNSNSQVRKYTKYIDSLFKNLEEEFIKYKEYHSEHFDAILKINDNELDDIVDNVYVDEYQKISKEDFCQCFFEFLREYGLESFFDKFITGRKIFNIPFNESEKYAGTVLHDPKKRKSCIVLCDFEYNVPYLLTCGHEFGHTYDMSKFNYNSDVHMKYSYSSVYGETISIVFEKLFYDFLFKKKYFLNDVKEIYSEFSFEGKNYILDAYIVSLLKDQTIRNLSFNCVSDGEIVEQVSNDFTKLDELFDHLNGRRLDTWKTPLYAYGDYLSTILKDSVQKEGLDSKLMREFLNFRTKTFNPDDLENSGFDMGTYQKVYKRDVARLKK